MDTMNKKLIAGLGIACFGLVLAGCTDNSNTLDNGGNSQSSSVADQSTDKSSGENASSSSQSGNIKLTLEEAIKAYEEAYPNTSITSIDLDDSFGTYYFEITGVDDDKEYEVKINAETGELKKEREEALDRDEQNGVERENNALDLTDLKTLDEISKIAVDSVGQGEAIEWSLDRELSTTHWEVKVRSGNSETSVKINAQTGDVLEKELDD